MTTCLAVDPNVTPANISLDEIREITARDAEGMRLFHVETATTLIHLVAPPTVYFSDAFGDSRYFAKSIPPLVHGRFLEVGPGTGVVTLAVVHATTPFGDGPRETTVAIDINPEAVRASRANAMLNEAEDQIDFRHGDVFDALDADETFDCIFWNHPFHRGAPHESVTQRACFDPMFQGLEIYIRDGGKHLREGGTLLLGSGKFADLDAIRALTAKHGCELVLLEYIHRPFEVTAGELKTFNVYQIRQREQ
jgi:release factor glutamine methyltransferase